MSFAYPNYLLSKQTLWPEQKLEPSTTICTCIEAGGLETQVVLLAESLRSFGGRWANIPMVAVKPRRGPRLTKSTISKLKQLNVHLVDELLNDQLSWWDHANKAAAMRFVERYADTEYVTWMDGDMMILREPERFLPAPGANFVARPGEASDVASNGNDEKVYYWNKLCDLFGLKFDEFGDIVSYPDKVTIRAYWQSGIYTYPKAVSFGSQHYEVFVKLLKTPIASKFSGIYHQDQVSVALTVQLLKLRYSQYDPRMNFNFNPLDVVSARLIPLKELYVLHYHGSLSSAHYGWARGGLRALSADRFRLIESYAPLNYGSVSIRLQRKLLRFWRKRKINAFAASVVEY